MGSCAKGPDIMLRVLTCSLNGRASITRPGVRQRPSRPELIQPSFSVTFFWYPSTYLLRFPLPRRGPSPRKPAEYNSIHGCLLPTRAHLLSCDAHPGYRRIAARYGTDPIFCQYSNFRSPSICFYLFYLTTSFSLLFLPRVVRDARCSNSEKRSDNSEILQVTVRTISTPADLLARITMCHRLFCFDSSARMNRPRASLRPSTQLAPTFRVTSGF